MAQGSETMICPRGHASTETDYCSECGAKLGGAAGASQGGSQQNGTAPGQVCPDCGTVREHDGTVFCEVCGYNFATGARGEVPVVAAAESAQAAVAPESAPDATTVPAAFTLTTLQRWAVTVSVDPSLRGEESPEAPVGVPSFGLALGQPVSLIGRRDDARGIFPEIALQHDEAVSRRHAVLQLDTEGGLLLRDIGASNGTRLNGAEIQPMVDYPLKDGDEITLGHWSRIRVEVS